MGRFIAGIGLVILLTMPCDVSRAQWIKTSAGQFNEVVKPLVVNGNGLYIGNYTGVFFSTDAGVSWTSISNGLPFEAGIVGIGVFGNDIFIGTYSGNFHSTNRGSDWTLDTTGIGEGARICCFAKSGNNLFAGAEDGFGVFLSTNNGLNWTAVHSGLPINSQIGGLSIMGSKLFAVITGGIINGGWGAGLYSTTDNGTTWTVDSAGMGMRQFEDIAQMGHYLFVSTGDSGIYRSSDTGASWSSINTGFPPNFTVFSLAASDTSASSPMLVAGMDSGLYLSTDYGASWKAEYSGLSNARIYSLAVGDSNLFAGTADSNLWRRSLSEMLPSSAVAQSFAAPYVIQTYPNPFSNATTITFTLTERSEADVRVVNILGATVARIFSGELDAGPHNVMWSKPPGLPAGMYECIVQMNGRVQRTAMVVN
jgi:photosystem II stability/assembly factor-like uncharacterized protein